MGDDKEYGEAVTKFHELYHPLAKAYNLRLHTRFTVYDKGLIEIYQHEGDKRGRQIVRTTDEDSTECYKRATEALESFKAKMDEVKKRLEESSKVHEVKILSNKTDSKEKGGRE